LFTTNATNELQAETFYRAYLTSGNASVASRHVAIAITRRGESVKNNVFKKDKHLDTFTKSSTRCR
jgi:hypothetical protein